MPEAAYRFEDALVFDGKRFHEHADVTVDGGRFNSQDLGQAEVIDASGKCLLPGFIDAHVHIGFFDPRVVLQGGVTTARDLGWPAAEIFATAGRLVDPSSSGPRLLAAGPMITAEGGYPVGAGWAPRGTALEISGAEEGRAAVRAVAEMGAAVIKIAQEPKAGPVMDSETVRAVVAEAHAAGLRVTSHLGALDQLEVALEAGVDELAHGLWSNETIPSALMGEMAASMAVVPTLHIDPSPQRIDNLGAFRDAGGRIVYGTDMGNTGPPPGIDPKELRLMVEAGMSLEEVLGSATAGAADWLGLEDTGSIEAGSWADLVLVDGDPRDDLDRLTRVVLVMRRGLKTGRP